MHDGGGYYGEPRDGPRGLDMNSAPQEGPLALMLDWPYPYLLCGGDDRGVVNDFPRDGAKGHGGTKSETCDKTF